MGFFGDAWDWTKDQANNMADSDFGWLDVAVPFYGATHALMKGGKALGEGAGIDLDGSDAATSGGSPVNLYTPAYQFGGNPDAAAGAMGRAYNTADAAHKFGENAYTEGILASRGVRGRGVQQGDWGQQNAYLEQAAGRGNALAGLEQVEGPSAAQAQLQQGTNQAMAGQLALARSGRGFGGGAGAAGIAQGNLAGLQANQANQAAALRAQENAAWRQRQAGNMVNAAGISGAVAGAYGQQQQTDLNAYYTGQGQNDAASLGYMGTANDAYFGGVDSRYRGDALAAGIAGQQMEGGQAYDDAQIRQWAAEKGYDLAERQRKDAANAAFLQGTASVASAGITRSDVRSKTDIVRSDAPAQDFARGGQPSPFAFSPQQPDTAALDAVAAAPGYGYKYEDPSAMGAAPGDQYGPMAQDLASTPAGATAVKRLPDGKLGIDTGRLALLNTSAVSSQQRELDELRQRLAAFEGHR
jgi:hypothetical protein